jgi:uncharacterized protein (DUF488 family)
MDLYTIGHSNHPVDKFIQLLVDHGIERLIDVRSTPMSRFNPQFNKKNMQQVLLKHQIEYVYAGAELGGRPPDPSLYKHNALPGKKTDYLHELNYPEVVKRPQFSQGIQQLLELAAEQPTTIMCSEENPAFCHRHHLISAYLLDKYPDVAIFHIRGDGSVITAKSIHTPSDQSGSEQLSF